MSWSDEDIDGFFRDAAAQKKVGYKDSFFTEIERELPVFRKRKSKLYWVMSYAMLVLFSLINFKIGKTESISFEEEKLNTTSFHSLPNKNSASSLTTGESSINDLKSAVSGFKDVHKESPQLTILLENKILETASNNNFPLLSSTTEISEIEIKTNPLSTSIVSGEIISRDVLFTEEPFRNKIYIQLRGGIGQGYSEVEDRNHTNGILSMEFGLNRSFRNFIISAGVNLQWTKLDDLKIKERTKIYGFDYSTYDNVYSFHAIASSGISVGLTRQLGRHNIGFSASPSVRLFALLDRAQSIDGEQFSFSQGVSDVSMFNKLALPIGFDYSYSINEFTQIGMIVSSELVQPISSDRFEGSPINNPLQIQFGIRTSLNR